MKVKSGNKICINCGTILGQVFVKNERRAYTGEEVKNRRQTEPSWREFGPRTILPTGRIDSKGQTINAKSGILFSRLSKIQRSLINSLERNLWEAKPKFKQFASKLNIPKYITETAWKIYNEVVKQKLTMGRSIDGFIAASIYAAIRIHEFPKLLDDVADVSMVPHRTLFRSLSLIVKKVLPRLHLDYHPISVNKLIFLFGNRLGLPIELQMKAIKIIDRSKKNRQILIGKDPKGLAAAVLYMVALKTEFKKTQIEVAKAAKTTEVTLRSRVKELKAIIQNQTSTL
ncbi:MAG: transcription initiation factor IIB family protein [Promethearchaeota archaeon]